MTIFWVLGLSVISYQLSGDRRQETGDRRQEIGFIYSPHFPLPPFPTPTLPHFPKKPKAQGLQENILLPPSAKV
ncbi:MAG: hypothetical protein ACK47N_01965 [Microcystis sp.]|uniref:hypothetical protein n=1 Tax=Microcystis TaxID=1125 RepID=UPI0022454B4E|nr:hypothetical protein [Microcystis aeruginosa]UZO74639.1 hypothetical protein M8120_17365 [Microcystis aeruginosa str. Chao 1910]